MSWLKKNRPISDITWFNQLDRAKGLDHSKTYDNMTAATCYMEFISLGEGKNHWHIVWITLTMDGSTDRIGLEMPVMVITGKYRPGKYSKF